MLQSKIREGEVGLEGRRGRQGGLNIPAELNPGKSVIKKVFAIRYSNLIRLNVTVESENEI